MAAAVKREPELSEGVLLRFPGNLSESARPARAPEGTVIQLRPDRAAAFPGNLDNETALPAPESRLPPSVAPSSSRMRRIGIAASALLHLGAALAFLALPPEETRIAGSQEAGAPLLGNADQDQASAGQPDTTQVTIVPYVAATAVTATESPVAPAIIAEADSAVEPVAETANALKPDSPAPVRATEAEAAERAETAFAQTPVVADPLPQILSVEATLEPDAQTVPPAPAVVEETPAEEPTAALRPDTPETAVTAEPEAAIAAEEETAIAAIPDTAPIPTPRAPEPERTVQAAKPKPAPQTKQTAEKTKPQPVRKAASAGSRGNSQADARRGSDSGEAEGRAASSGRRGLFSTAGNAAVSNYPGKVVAKLRRALRYPSEARRSRLTGTVQVAFTISANGNASGVRMVRGSGSPVLDQAALEAVQRAAPFPPIPAESGRKSWPFAVPLAFTNR